MTFLQALTVDILLGLWPCLSLSRRTGPFSPASTSANFCLGCLVFAWIVIWSGTDLTTLQVAGIAFGITASQEASIAAAHIYLLIIFLSFLSAHGLRKKKDVAPQGVESRWLQSAKKLAKRSLAFHSFMAPVLLGVCVLHLLFALLPNLESFYFTDRSNIIVGPVLVCSVLFCYYSFKLKSKSYFLFYLLCFIYSFALMLGSYSRLIPGIFFILALCVTADSSWKKLWLRNAFTLFCVCLSLFFFIYSLIGREGRDQGLNYPLVWHYLLATANPGNVSILVSVAANVFHGVFLLAECIDTRTASYSAAYQLLSFSPFPTFIDGWDKVAGEQIRVNFYTPFSTFGEIYFFSPVLQAALVGIYFYCSRTMTRFYAHNVGWRRVFIAVIGLLCWVFSHQYPARNVFRVLLISVVLALVLRPKTRKSTSPRGARIRRPHPFPVRSPVATMSASHAGEPSLSEGAAIVNVPPAPG